MSAVPGLFAVAIAGASMEGLEDMEVLYQGEVYAVSAAHRIRPVGAEKRRVLTDKATGKVVLFHPTEASDIAVSVGSALTSRPGARDLRYIAKEHLVAGEIGLGLREHTPTKPVDD